VSRPDVCVYQCPLCENWQMDYSMQMMLREFGQFTITPTGEMQPSMGLFEQTIEDVLREHLGEEHPDALEWFDAHGSLP
jgi:hypothetical protein